MDRRTRRVFAVGWLFLLHGLASLTVALYDCHDIAPWLTDPLLSALQTTQIALLAAWLAMGVEPWSWRVCGTTAGSCFILMVSTRYLFPAMYVPFPGLRWQEFEWWYFFRPSGPGDWLVKLPVLLAAILLPLGLFRLTRALTRNGRLRLPPQPRWGWHQFRFLDLFLWTATLSIILGVYVGLRVYPGWYRELSDGLFTRWRGLGSLQDLRLYVALFYAGMTIASGWLLFRPRVARWQVAVLSLAVLLISIVLEAFWQRAQPLETAPTGLYGFPFTRPSEVILALLAWPLLLASMQLLKLYDGPLRVVVQKPGRTTPDKILVHVLEANADVRFARTTAESTRHVFVEAPAE